MGEEARTVVLDGKEALVTGDPNDPYFQAAEGHAAALSGFGSFVRQTKSEHPTAIDVGANIGLSTLILARHFDRVIAFEPSSINFSFLERNLKLNNVNNVELHNAAVSSTAQTLKFHVAQFGAGSHVVGPGHVLSANIPSVDVQAIPLDDMTLPAIGLVKIDVEGHEPDVLAGARKLLARDRPVIFTEINAWCLSAFAGHSLGAFVSKLWEAFEVFLPGADGATSPSTDPYGFLHDLITRKHGVSDIVLRPKQSRELPTLRELTWPQAAIDALSGKLV